MPAPPSRPDEAERLAILRSFGLLQSGTDARLQRIVLKLADAFRVPIAAVTLLDETRQEFKASVGLGVPHTPRDVAFCGYTILGDAPLVVLDAVADARFVDNPIVTGPPHIRFYAGTAIHGPGNVPLGALCAIDTERHAGVAPDLLDELRALATEVSAILGFPPAS